MTGFFVILIVIYMVCAIINAMAVYSNVKNGRVYFKDLDDYIWAVVFIVCSFTIWIFGLALYIALGIIHKIKRSK